MRARDVRREMARCSSALVGERVGETTRRSGPAEEIVAPRWSASCASCDPILARSQAMQIMSLQGLYELKLRQTLDAEEQVADAAPHMAQEVRNEQLRSALEQHIRQSEGHI